VTPQSARFRVRLCVVAVALFGSDSEMTYIVSGGAFRHYSLTHLAVRGAWSPLFCFASSSLPPSNLIVA